MSKNPSYAIYNLYPLKPVKPLYIYIHALGQLAGVQSSGFNDCCETPDISGHQLRESDLSERDANVKEVMPWQRGTSQ